ncbi:MAG: hypothetical protein ACRYHA_28175 [Janthinobacterium lividum]
MAAADRNGAGDPARAAAGSPCCAPPRCTRKVMTSSMMNTAPISVDARRIISMKAGVTGTKPK